MQLRATLLTYSLLLIALSGCQHKTPMAATPPLLARPSLSKPAARLVRTRQSAPTLLGRGDFLLDNGLVSAAVLGLAHGELAGSLSRARSGKGSAQLGPLMPLLGGRPLRFQRAYLRDGQRAAVRFEGAEGFNAGLAVTLQYSLARGARSIHVSLRVQRGVDAGPWRGRLGVQLAPGLTREFAPGGGYRSLPPRCEKWIEFHGPTSSYALGCTQRWRLRRATSGALISSHTLVLAPGQSFHYQTTLIIAQPGWSATLRPLLPTRGPTAPLQLSLLDERGEPLPRAILDILRGQRPIARARTAKDGRVSIPLAPDTYSVHAFARGRQVKALFSLPPGGHHQVLRSGAPSQLVFDLRRDAARAESVQLRVIAADKPSTPYLLGPKPLAGPDTWIAPEGRGVLSLPPGKYRIEVLRPLGPPRLHEVSLSPFRGAELVSRGPKALAQRPPCRLLVDATTAQLHRAETLQHWARAAGCVGPGDPQRLFGSSAGAARRILRALGAKAPSWPRGARAGADVRYVPRAFSLGSAAPRGEATRPPNSAPCVFFSEGPIFELTRGKERVALGVRLPPSFRLEKALLGHDGKLLPASPNKGGMKTAFTLDLSKGARLFGVSARSSSGQEIVAFGRLDRSCLSASPQGATTRPASGH